MKKKDIYGNELHVGSFVIFESDNHITKYGEIVSMAIYSIDIDTKSSIITVFDTYPNLFTVVVVGELIENSTERISILRKKICKGGLSC